MFKNLKDKLATQVTKTNQTLFSTILSPDSTLLSNARRSSITNSDETVDGNRSRLDSASSDISQTPSNHTSYVSPTRQHMPPSDIESEHGGDESDHETNSKMNKLLSIYKNKFAQLKNAYDEVERDKDNIKRVLQEQQDTYIKRQKQFRDDIKREQEAKEQVELTYKKDIILRDHTIEELTQKLTVQKGLLQSDQDEIRTLRDKNTKLETLLTKCKEAIKTHQEKQVDLVTERDHLSQQLTEKQTIIDSMKQDLPSSDASLEVQEHSDLDISVLLRDKEHLQEQLESARLSVQQLEAQLEAGAQQTKAVLTEESDQRYEDLFVRFETKSTDFEQLLNEKVNLERANEEFQILIKTCQETILQDQQALDTLKTEYANLTDEFHQTKQARDRAQSLLDQTTEGADTQHKAALNKLQDDYNTSQANCAQLTEQLDALRQEQSTKLQALHDENNQLESQIVEKENEYRQEVEKTRNDHSSQIGERQEEIDRLQHLLEEEKSKSSRLTQIESDSKQFQSQSQQLTDEYNSLKEQYQQTVQSNVSKSDQLTKLQEEFNAARKRLEDELEQKDNHIAQLNATNSQLKKANEEQENTEKEAQEQLNEKSTKLEQTEQKIRELQAECDAFRTEVVSLVNTNEENTRRLDEFAEEKFNLEQELEERTRQIAERDEKIQEVELTLKQAQDSGAKLRKALQNKKEAVTDNEQSLQKVTGDYEQRLKEQDADYQMKLKAMAKEMSSQIEEKEQTYNQQLKDFIKKSYQTETGLIQDSEAKINSAEQRALIAEEQMSKIQESLQEKQLDHYRVAQDLQNQIESLTKKKPLTTEHFSQTQIEDLNHSIDGQHSFIFEPTEVDYLKQIVLAYMTGTDRVTMAKVICAVLRYSDDEKSQIVEHEKLRQTRWLSSPR